MMTTFIRPKLKMLLLANTFRRHRRQIGNCKTEASPLERLK